MDKIYCGIKPLPKKSKRRYGTEEECFMRKKVNRYGLFAMTPEKLAELTKLLDAEEKAKKAAKPKKERAPRKKKEIIKSDIIEPPIEQKPRKRINLELKPEQIIPPVPKLKKPKKVFQKIVPVPDVEQEPDIRPTKRQKQVGEEYPMPKIEPVKLVPKVKAVKITKAIKSIITDKPKTNLEAIRAKRLAEEEAQRIKEQKKRDIQYNRILEMEKAQKEHASKIPSQTQEDEDEDDKRERIADMINDIDEKKYQILEKIIGNASARKKYLSNPKDKEMFDDMVIEQLKKYIKSEWHISYKDYLKLLD